MWVGSPDLVKKGRVYVKRQLKGLTIGGHFYSRVFGATIAAPIWSKIMVLANQGLPVKDFPNPPAKMLIGDSVRLPDVSGQSIAAAIGTLTGMGFKTTVATRHSQLQLPRRNRRGHLARRRLEGEPR